MKQRIKDKFIYLIDRLKAIFLKIFSSRMHGMLTAIFLLFTIVVVRLFYLQIIKTEYFTENFTQKAQKVITTNAARGKIYDASGNLLAYNELSYSVAMTDEIPSSDEKGEIINGIIDRMVKLIESNGDKIIDDFNIELDDYGRYVFKSNPVTKQTTFLINIFGVSSDKLREKGYDKYTADQIMNYLCDERYEISNDYSRQEQLKIVTIRYALSLTAYRKYVSTIIAKNVNLKTVAAILESTDDMTGVEVVEEYKRLYNHAEYFSHIIGYIGEISGEELEEYNLENEAGITYSVGDYVGKSGVEQSFDSYLQGIKGTKSVFVDSTGNILEVLDETKSQSGNDLYLTVDLNMQMAAYNILEKKLAAALINKIVDGDVDKKEKQTYVYIPIKDVYYKLLTNIIDFTKFSREDASEREKKTLEIFGEKKKEAVRNIAAELYNPAAKPSNLLTEEYKEYMDFVYDLLGSTGILDKSLIDARDATFQEWNHDNTSLRIFLQHAIAENWIDVSALDSSRKYSDSDAIYNTVVENAVSLLSDNRDFSKQVLYYMVYNGDVSPYDICLMLYDQEKLQMDDMYTALVQNRIDTYTYIINQIERLTLTPAMLALDPCSGSLCVADSETGKVIALVSYPTYNNNLLTGTVDSKYWYDLNINESQPLFNYATSALTAPGSTFKLVTAVAGLAENYIDIDTIIEDMVYFEQISPSPKCHIAPESHGKVNITTAIEHSCNYLFFQIGYDMGLDQHGEYNSVKALDIIEDYAIQLGLGIKSGIEMRETEPRISTTDSVRTAIGQGTNGYATVQMTRYVNTIANSGLNYRLSIVDKVIGNNDNIVLSADPVVTNIVELEPEEWGAIQQGMSLVPISGTASRFFRELKVPVAGKTGTAEENLYRSNHAAFVGYAPYGKPDISFACMIRNCDSTSYPGGVLSDLLQYYFGEITLEDVFDKPVENTIEGFHSE
ncbi:MAG: penicillin-binding transpeptidase domain-containing protein [Lachnospiraceae bacterium]|jgi:penicillin-binding protein 2